MEPLIVLDLDGVFSPYVRPGPQWSAHKVSLRGRTTQVMLNPAHGPALLRLASETGGQLVWGTSWDHEANSQICPLLGLPDLPVFVMDDVPDVHVPRVHPKTPLIAKYAGSTPFVWFDDETCDVDRLWLESRSDAGPVKLIHVDGRRGLTSEHIEQARLWLDGLPRQES